MNNTLEFARTQVGVNRGKPREAMWREIVEALEKQVPKKPIEHQTKENNGETEYFVSESDCPVCKHNFFGGRARFCSKCGQAIDWSGENE